MVASTLEQCAVDEPSLRPSLKSEQEFFDTQVLDHGSFNPFEDRGWKTLERRFQDFIGGKKIDSLLDIGCGTGESRKIYTDHILNYTGIDLSSASIKFAQERFPDSNWLVADACELPFENDTFDVVTFSSVLHHIDDFEIALKQAYRVLKPGGIVFAFDPNLYHPAMALFRCPQSPCYIQSGVSPNERPLRPAQLNDAFQASGFEKIRQRCQSDLPYRAVAPKLINACLTAYNIVDRVWEASGLGRWFGTFVVTSGEKPAINKNSLLPSEQVESQNR